MCSPGFFNYLVVLVVFSTIRMVFLTTVIVSCGGTAHKFIYTQKIRTVDQGFWQVRSLIIKTQNLFKNSLIRHIDQFVQLLGSKISSKLEPGWFKIRIEWKNKWRVAPILCLLHICPSMLTDSNFVHVSMVGQSRNRPSVKGFFIVKPIITVNQLGSIPKCFSILTVSLLVYFYSPFKT